MIMKKEIRKQLEKIYVAVYNAYSLNDVRVKPNDDIADKLLNISRLTKECLELLEAEN